VAQALREFSQLFIYSKKLEGFSTLSRLCFSTLLVVSSILAGRAGGDVGVALSSTTVLVVGLGVLSYFRGVRSVLRALTLVALFISIAMAIQWAGCLLGWLRPSPMSVIAGTLWALTLFIAFSSYFQLLSLREWRSILNKLGFKTASLLLSLVVLQMPTTLIYTSEAFTTIKLKYGGRRLYKVVLPLVILSLFTARSYAEAIALYGVTTEAPLTLYKKRDILLYLVSTLQVFSTLLIDMIV
jgi:hypothetical protein